MKKVILAVALLVSGSAFAAENLTVAQMDAVTAGWGFGGKKVIIDQTADQTVNVKNSDGNQVITVGNVVTVDGNTNIGNNTAP